MRHVAGGVNVDEEADAGDDGEHDEGEVVDGEGEVDLKAGDLDPGPADGAEDADVPAEHGGPEPGDEEAGDSGKEQSDAGNGGTREPAAEGAVEEEADEGEDGDPPEIGSGHLSSLARLAGLWAHGVSVRSIPSRNTEVPHVAQVDDVGGSHSFMRLIWSTLRVWRVRKMAMMMARPTAASAAATTMTKKTKICPWT